MITEGILAEAVHKSYFWPPSLQKMKVLRVFVEELREEAIPAFVFPKCSRKFIAQFDDFLGNALQYTTSLDFSFVSLLADEILRKLCDFKNLKNLNLSSTNLIEQGYRLLLSKFRATNNGFDSLEVLQLVETNITENHLRTIFKFPKLKYLSFSNNTVRESIGQPLNCAIVCNSKNVYKPLDSLRISEIFISTQCTENNFKVVSVPVEYKKEKASLICNLLQDWMNYLSFSHEDALCNKCPSKYTYCSPVYMVKCSNPVTLKRRLSPQTDTHCHKKQNLSCMAEIQDLTDLYL